MAKTSKVDVYDIINQRIIDALETGTVPWRMPWKRNTEAPRNLISGKPYRSINHFLLRSMSYASPHWLTFKQARDLGGHVRKGEKACPVTFWKQWIPADQKELPKEEQTQRWLGALIDDGLRELLRRDMTAQQAWREAETKVAAGELPATTAAAHVLRAFRRAQGGETT